MIWRKQKNEKDNIVLDVKWSEDKEVYKNNIISEFYKNGIIFKKIKGYFNRYGIPYGARLEEDLYQIVFEELCKKSADEIIEMYEDDPSRLVALCNKIAHFKGVADNKTKNPKRNFTRYVLFFSRLSYGNSEASEQTALDFLLDEDTDLTENEIELKDLGNSFDKYLSKEALKTLQDFRQEHQEDTKQRKASSIQKHLNRRTTDKRRFGSLLIETNLIINNKIKNQPMDKETILNEIEKVLPQIREYHRTRKVGHLTTEDLIDIKSIWDKYINPAGKLLTSCPSCVKDAIDILESFYSANKPKVMQAEPVEKEPTKITFEGVVEAPTPVEAETGLAEIKAFATKEKAISKTAVKKVNGRQKTKK